MAYNYSKNIEDEVSFEMAKLVGRERVNNLGSQELVVDYHKVTAKNREEATDWLEANRLTMTDPEFSYKVYEGTWNCISITYNEDTNVIRQTFKIDSQVGDLGDTDVTPVSSQVGDLSRISDGMRLERAYYWRVVSPEGIELPDPADVGEIWTKTANDNGDGTYDVTVSKEVAQDQTALNAMQYGGEYDANSDIEVIGAGSSGVNGTYTVSGTQDGKNVWYNGSYYISWRVGDTKWFITETTLLGLIYYEVASASTFPPPSGWVRIVGSDPAPTLIIGSGTGGPYNEETNVNTNTDEKKFVSDGGLIADATDGLIKTITNTPLENGKYRTSVTTRTAKEMRMPSSEGSFFAYSSDFLVTGKAIIIGRNRTYESFTDDTQLLRGLPYYNRINNVSVRVNDFGLFDYTITSNEPS